MDAVRWDPPPEPGLLYLLDRGHNPDPLSAAQASLVEICDQPGLPVRQLVRNGYLYYATVKDSAGRTVPPFDLPRRYAEEMLPSCERLLLPFEEAIQGAADPRAPSLPLGDAVTAYKAVYRIYIGQVAASVRGAREQLDHFLTANFGEGLDRHLALLGGQDTVLGRRMRALWQLGRADPGQRERLLAAYARDFGAFCPMWDVAVPCDDEVPERALAAALALKDPSPSARMKAAEEHYRDALRGLCARLGQEERAALSRLVTQARAAVAIAEDDDAIFYRLQRVMRRSLLGEGARLVGQGRLRTPEEVFHLPIGLLLAQGGPADLEALVDQARRDAETCRALVPPERFVDGLPEWAGSAGAIMRGSGVAPPGIGPVRGKARLISSLGSQPPLDEVAGLILVLPALLPSWAPIFLSARALVTDHGGVLSHGAILALEAGVPAVVGTQVATRQIREGDDVLVDADQGEVRILSTGGRAPRSGG